MKKNIYAIFLFFLIIPFQIIAENIDYGLFIKSFPSNDTEKTSFVLENGQPLKLHKETSMTFDLKVRKDNVFGIVFRMITDKKDNIDLIFTVGENNKRYPMLAVNETVYMINQEVVCDQWSNASITLSSQKDSIILIYDKNRISVPVKLSDRNSVMVSFGICPFHGYTLYDIASVSIRDIKIYNSDKLTRYWKLEKHDKTQSLDLISDVPAVATNPLWITDTYALWNKIYSSQVKDNSLFAFDSERGIFYFVSPDSKEVTTFDVDTHQKSVIKVHGGLIAANAPNQLVFDPSKKNLVSYNLDENKTSTFSFKHSSWDGKDKSVLEHGYWNNSVSYYKNDSSIISFGGYGFYKYNNDLIRLSTTGEPIRKSNLPEISPRYSSATVISGNTLYIFGGRGNKSGRQELSPKNHYDFYSVNLLTEQTNKLWEINADSINTDFLPSENMVYNESENCFYVFTTKDGGTLLRIKKELPNFEQVSYSINENFLSHYLYTNLYFSAKQKKFYILINKMYTDKPAEVFIYSLNYPPVVINPTSVDNANDNVWQVPLWVYLLSGLVVAVFILLLFIYYRKKNKGENSEQAPNPSSNSIETTVAVTKTVEKKFEGAEHKYYDFSKQSIILLGGFCVIDKNGRNITGQFTPMLKYLLVLLILSTQKDIKGISGKKLIQLLWFDKNEESAKNNRNVYLSKLRAIMENIGAADIINENGFWSIKLSEEITCDYNEVMFLFSNVKEKHSAELTNIDKLLELLLRGGLLPNTEVDWIDGYKSDFSNLTIDILTDLMKSNRNRLTDELLLKIADALLLHDYINEEALCLKCSIFFNSGKIGMAKTIYDNFCKEYNNLLGETYKYTLTEVIERSNRLDN